MFARLLPPEDPAKRQITSGLDETRLQIEYLGTADAIRQRGVGTRLVEAAEGWGRNAGATISYTSTYQWGAPSVPFKEERKGY